MSGAQRKAELSQDSFDTAELVAIETFFDDPDNRDRLMNTARQILREKGVPESSYSDESVVNSAAADFLRRVRKGDYADNATAEEFRKLLNAFMRNKVRNRAKQIHRPRQQQSSNETLDVSDASDETSREVFDVARSSVDFSILFQAVVERIDEKTRDAEQAEVVRAVLGLWLQGLTGPEMEKELDLPRSSILQATRLFTKIFVWAKKKFGDCEESQGLEVR